MRNSPWRTLSNSYGNSREALDEIIQRTNFSMTTVLNIIKALHDTWNRMTDQLLKKICNPQIEDGNNRAKLQQIADDFNTDIETLQTILRIMYPV
jgi:sugar-specific transcriptional regulator TrmB